MIEAKPRKGQHLERMANWPDHVNDGAKPIWEPLGTVDHCDGNLCWFTTYGQETPGEGDLFIWRFPDEMNRCHRVVTPAELRPGPEWAKIHGGMSGACATNPEDVPDERMTERYFWKYHANCNSSG